MLGDIPGPSQLLAWGASLHLDGGWLSGYAVARIVIGLACYSIPVLLMPLALRHPELRMQGLYAWLSAVMLACGTVVWIDVLVLWWPVQHVQLLLSVTAAVVAALAVVAMVLRAPRLSRQLRERQKSWEHTQAINADLAMANQTLSHNETLLRETLHSAPIGFATIGINGRIRAANRTLCEMVGYSEKELLKLRIVDITHPDDHDRDLAQLDEVLGGSRRGYRMLKRYLHRGERLVDVQLDVTLLRDGEGKPVHFIYQVQDITLRMQEERMLEVRACTDDLTALPNRRAFFEEGRRLLARAQRQREDVTLVMMDLDHFKSINDTFGHASGDRVLRTVKEILAPRLRAGDLLARLGGEEFAILLPNTSSQYSRFVAERIRESIARADIMSLDGRKIGMTASLGLAIISGRETLEGAMERADQALYQAKTRGRDCVVEAPPRQAPTREPDTVPLSSLS